MDPAASAGRGRRAQQSFTKVDRIRSTNRYAGTISPRPSGSGRCGASFCPGALSAASGRLSSFCAGPLWRFLPDLSEQGLFLFGEDLFLQKVRAVAECCPQGLLQPPFPDLLVIPGEKNVRDPVSIKVSRLRVLGILKKPVLKGLPLGGCLL